MNTFAACARQSSCRLAMSYEVCSRIADLLLGSIRKVFAALVNYIDHASTVTISCILPIPACWESRPVISKALPRCKCALAHRAWRLPGTCRLAPSQGKLSAVHAWFYGLAGSGCRLWLTAADARNQNPRDSDVPIRRGAMLHA